jgi:hypothetical protein
VRHTLAIVAVVCFAIALLELLTSSIRHNVLAWIAGGLLALALRCATEGVRVND